ncbi:hypothetical protein BV25DRAFT_703934 [Artomyces pyxidatus]|uniref:Uncharacterized protein n=1 Tax=Artomyces pyxidatus TaxID=48021 RepID=A0ACB8T103_9AGAM|nr:hypothetical protein BV25DRAFT_703934 [Artomyces pyxidatus]
MHDACMHEGLEQASCPSQGCKTENHVSTFLTVEDQHRRRQDVECVAVRLLGARAAARRGAPPSMFTQLACHLPASDIWFLRGRSTPNKCIEASRFLRRGERPDGACGARFECKMGWWHLCLVREVAWRRAALPVKPGTPSGHLSYISIVTASWENHPATPRHPGFPGPTLLRRRAAYHPGGANPLFPRPASDPDRRLFDTLAVPNPMSLRTGTAARSFELPSSPERRSNTGTRCLSEDLQHRGQVQQCPGVACIAHKCCLFWALNRARSVSTFDFPGARPLAGVESIFGLPASDSATGIFLELAASRSLCTLRSVQIPKQAPPRVSLKDRSALTRPSALRRARLLRMLSAHATATLHRHDADKSIFDVDGATQPCVGHGEPQATFSGGSVILASLSLEDVSSARERGSLQTFPAQALTTILSMHNRRSSTCRFLSLPRAGSDVSVPRW